jgi:CRISPR-associated protein Csx3
MLTNETKGVVDRMNSLPAILIGGPPHAGKSVLFYSLTHALRERHIPHHAIRACLDGEGNWSQESHPDTVSQIRLSVKTAWPASFAERISQSIEHRCLPFLIDMGGRPRDTQIDLFRHCTHAILLLREDQPADTLIWQRFIQEHGVIPLAQLYSILAGEAQITQQFPVLEGTITGLERHRMDRAHGPAFDQLVDRVATLLSSYTPQDLERVYFERAPGDLINLSTFIAPGTRWQPEMLPFF